MRLTIFVLLLLNLAFAKAQELTQTVSVKGHAPDYAGYHLVVRKIVNPITRETTDLMTIQVQEDGRFQQSIELRSIVHASIDMGKFMGYIYLEPGQSYELVLPPFKPRTDAERFNPYFIPEEIELGIANDEAQNLNILINQFNDKLASAYNANAVQIFSRADVTKANGIVKQIDDEFPSQSVYFNKYKQYAYGELINLAYKRNKRKAMYLAMQGDSIVPSMPSFQKTFDVLFKSFFSYYFSSSKGESLRDAYAKGASFDSLSTVFRKDTLFANAELAELVLLKGLYDAFYSGRYKEDVIIELVKQASHTASTVRIKQMAEGIYKKLTWLREGTEAPQFTLYRLDGKERSLSDYEGKFVYLNFMHTSNHTCKQDLQLLNVFSKQLRRELTIVTVIMDEDPSEAIKLQKENKYKWDFLHYKAMPKVAVDYQVKALPAYFVIDPSQKLRLSPSPSPGESFVPIFSETQRRYHYEQLRKEQPKHKTIYDF